MSDYPVCPECRERFAKTRGLCLVCYGRLAARVRADKTTWQQLEQEGKVERVKTKKAARFGERWR